MVELEVLLKVAFESSPQPTLLHAHFGECAARNAVKRWVAGVVVIIGRALVVWGDVDDGDDMSARG